MVRKIIIIIIIIFFFWGPFFQENYVLIRVLNVNANLSTVKRISSVSSDCNNASVWCSNYEYKNQRTK